MGSPTETTDVSSPTLKQKEVPLLDPVGATHRPVKGLKETQDYKRQTRQYIDDSA